MAEDRSASRSLVVGAATNWAAFAATLAVSFFLAPYLVRSLGDARYGVWCVVESILAYFTLLDLGIAACLVRFVAKYHAVGARAELNRIISSAVGLFTLAALVVTVLGAALTPFVAPGLERQLDEPGDVLPFMLLMVVNWAITLPLSAFPSILDGLQRFGTKSAVRLACLAVRVGAIVGVMETRPGLLPLALVFTAVNLLEHGVLALVCFRCLPGLQLSLRWINRATLREIQGYSLDAFLAMLAGRITVQSGAIIVGGFLSVAAAAHYAIAARLVDMAKTLLRSATTTLTPAVSHREATGDLDGVRRVLFDGTRWMLYLVLPIHGGLLAFGAPFLARWMGHADYATWCFPPAAILSATLTLGVAQSVASRILYGMGQLKVFARLALVEAAVNIGLSLMLVGPLGVVGVAVGVAVPHVVFCIVVIFYTCYRLNVDVKSYFIWSWLKPLGTATIPVGVWGLLGPPEATWPSIALGIVAGLGPYACAVLAAEWRGLVGLGGVRGRGFMPVGVRGGKR